MSNIEENNHQQDNMILFLVKISIVSRNSSLDTGKHVAQYFPMNYNRNLPILANIVKTMNDDDEGFFSKGFVRGLEKQKLPNLINNWNLKHVMTLLENKAVKPSIHIKFSVENKHDWGESVNDLINLGCRPYVKVVIEQTEQMEALLSALQTIEQPKIPKLILHFGYVDIGLTELTECWPYPNPLLIMSTHGKYSMEAYLTCLSLVNILGKNRVKNLIFSGDESSYVYGLLRKALPNTNVHLRPSQRTTDYIVINTKS